MLYRILNTFEHTHDGTSWDSQPLASHPIGPGGTSSGTGLKQDGTTVAYTYTYDGTVSSDAQCCEACMLAIPPSAPPSPPEPPAPPAPPPFPPEGPSSPPPPPIPFYPPNTVLAEAADAGAKMFNQSNSNCQCTKTQHNAPNPL